MSSTEIAFAYHGLHAKEKEKLLETATRMKEGLDALMPLVMDRFGNSYLGFGDFAERFEEVAEKVAHTFAEIEVKHMYYYAPKTYAWCRETLDEGLRRLEQGKAGFESADTVEYFDSIKAQGEVCKQCVDAYVSAWSAIKAFDKKHTFAWYQRKQDHHAFESGAKADMAEMLEMLRGLHVLSV